MTNGFPFVNIIPLTFKKLDVNIITYISPAPLPGNGLYHAS